MMSSTFDSIGIRLLTPSETDLFRTVRLQALEDSPDSFGETLQDAIDSDWCARTASLFQSSPADRAVYVALANMVPIGMVFVRCGAESEPAFVGGMWVHPRFRRQGVGRELVASALKFLQGAKQMHVSLWVTAHHLDAVRFYEAQGFHVTGETSTLRPKSDIEIVELICSLSSA